MFITRQILTNARRVVPSLRDMSSSAQLVGVEMDKEGIATVTMQRPPVNSLNLELLQHLCQTFDELERHKCKAMILTSSSPTVFSAGLDIMEIYKPDLKRLEVFWTTLQEMWIKLFGSSFITAAAINGHAPAGGCLLSVSCEYRVMVAGKYTIGVNEAALGIFPPQWLMKALSNTIPQRQAELAVTTAKMFSVDEALKVGLIDESATDKADSIEKCKKFIKKFDGIPPLARAITKQKIREAPLAWMQKNRANDLQAFLELFQSQEVQQYIEMYLQSMKRRDAK